LAQEAAQASGEQGRPTTQSSLARSSLRRTQAAASARTVPRQGNARQAMHTRCSEKFSATIFVALVWFLFVLQVFIKRVRVWKIHGAAPLICS